MFDDDLRAYAHRGSLGFDGAGLTRLAHPAGWVRFVRTLLRSARLIAGGRTQLRDGLILEIAYLQESAEAQSIPRHCARVSRAGQSVSIR
jgi:1-acyl-sn-glycerol-3-phosphate acyltransferase